jgi:hypothetical protein
LVSSRKQWRHEFAKWAEHARTQDVDEGDDDAVPSLPIASSSWLPRSLNLLFGGRPVEDNSNTLDGYLERRRSRRQGWSEEALRMELLVQEELDGIPDDGELEGSGDEYDGH